MNELNLSAVGMEPLGSSSVANTLPVSGGHLGLTASPPHNALTATGLPVAIPNLGPSLGSLPSALSVMLPMGIGERGVMCGLPDRNFPLPPPPYPHLENSYFRHLLPGILSYLADRPPPQYIHPSSLSVDSSGGLSVSSSNPSLDPYHSGPSVGLESGIVSLDSRSVGGHGGQSLHPSDAHEVALDAGMGMDDVSRVTSPITSEELTIEGVTGEHGQITSRPHEPLTVDASLPPDAVGHAGVLPLHSGSLELPVVMESEHHMDARSGMSDNALTDAIHTVALSSNPVSVTLSTSHPLSSLTAVSLHGNGLSLEPVTVSSITPDGVTLPHVDATSLTFVPTSLHMDSTSNKENMAALFTIWCTLCNRAYPADCPEHGPVTFIPDSPIESRARLSFPKQLVLRQSVTGVDVGVWTQDSISVRTCFGPLIGQESQSLEVAGWTDKSANHIWKIYSNNVMEFCVITTDENECNWMMFVRKARNPDEQNLVAYPHNGKIYFYTTRDIPAQEELLFYYSRDYAQQMGLPEQPEMLLCHCGKECLSYAEFKSHLSSHIGGHLPGGESLSSEDTGQAVTSSKERKWKCTVCPRSFSSSTKLNVHYMGHMGMKPHKCEFCSKAFSDPSNLRTHLRIHTGQKNHHCVLCGKSFTQKAHVASHMVTHTGEKNFKCDFCEKMFMRRQDLKQHILTHTRERPLKCPKCDKHFCRTNHLKKHLNSHEGKRDYVCEKCSKAFLTKYHLTRHLKICKGPSPAPLTDQDEEDDESEEEGELLSADCPVFSADAHLPPHT
ncbi:PR domain zinc finger protein 4 [Dendrobates tinctorius]|uniref:PR domain zinc finger protein 4 n=1 Tax=Dendrobates tinctorius TaxID=92724 RepID=UPI003CC940E5